MKKSKDCKGRCEYAHQIGMPHSCACECVMLKIENDVRAGSYLSQAREANRKDAVRMYILTAVAAVTGALCAIAIYIWR
jgi:hypothetical protein